MVDTFDGLNMTGPTISFRIRPMEAQRPPIYVVALGRGGEPGGEPVVHLAQRALAGTAHLDVVLTPTLADVPAEIGAIRDDADPAADFEAQKRFTPYTSPYNMTGQPAVSLPLHWTEDGLPVGIQLVGRPMEEALVLRVAAQVERAHPWAHRHPEVW